MSKDIEKTLKEIIQLEKILIGLQEGNNKELSNIKKFIRSINKRLDDISDKIQEFEIILDDNDEDNEQDESYKQNDEFIPYDENNFISEDYESYNDDNEQIS